jgi:SAM-dependent methyltransferase
MKSVRIVSKLLPYKQRTIVRQRLTRARQPAWLGTARRTTPFSDRWGLDRGTPVDRTFIESFLANNRRDIRGQVLEVQSRNYTTHFGAGVTSSDVLDVERSNPLATIICDLADGSEIDSDRFDCFVLTQTLQFIRDPAAAISQAHRILRPGGVLLATVPGVSRIDGALAAIDYWRFTQASVYDLACTAFLQENIKISAYGNVLSAVAFLMGLASEELSSRELKEHDPRYPVIVALRAVKE